MVRCINWRESFQKKETCHLSWDKLKRKMCHLQWDAWNIHFREWTR